MKIKEFKLERYFAEYEFTAKYLLSNSDCDGFSMQYVLDQASDDELSLWQNLKLGYTETSGHPLLRKAICNYYQNVTTENIVVASPGELNFIVMNVLLEPSDHVVAISPAYQSLHEIVKSIGCDISLWKSDINTRQFNVDQLQTLIKKNTKLIIINFPHNPLGDYLTRKDLDKIVAIARQNNCYIFSDEMYHKLVVDDIEELLPISDIYEKGISLWGTSKTFGLAGLRIGWIVSQDEELLCKVLDFKDYLSICNSAISEILAIIALNHSDKFIQHNISKIEKNIELFKAFTQKHSSIFSFVPPKAGSTALVGLNVNESSMGFSKRLVEETGVLVVPAELFDIEGKYIRIGFGRDNFADALEKLDHFILSYTSTNKINERSR